MDRLLHTPPLFGIQLKKLQKQPMAASEAFTAWYVVGLAAFSLLPFRPH